ncbi:MAG: 5-formyltetrahydrofolate cyclo-ligase [Patescibacteria group bacterium]
MDPRDEKSKLRHAIRERLAAYPERQRHAESRTLCREIIKILPKGNAFSVAAYFPLKDEADVRPLLEELLARGAKLYLPRFDHKNFSFRLVRDLQSLLPGALRIPEPSETAPLLDPSALEYALIPARAFSPDGHRLGRGNGGYDKWISEQRKRHPRTKMYGIALECQLFAGIPVEPHDEKVDGIITARGLLTQN